MNLAPVFIVDAIHWKPLLMGRLCWLDLVSFIMSKAGCAQKLDIPKLLNN